MRLAQCASAVGAVLTLQSVALAASYYVSPAGSDANAGTQAAPWATIQKAANTMVAGDVVNVLPGDYAEHVNVNTSGVQGGPITYQAQGTATVRGFTVSADYVTIHGFTSISLADGAIGILVSKGGWCDIQNNIVEFNAMGGISLQGLPSNPAATHDCIVSNNVLYRNGMFGIEVMGLHHLIENNDVSHTIQHSPCNVANANASWLDADGIRFFGGGHTFRHNKIHDIPFGAAGYAQGTACTLANLQNIANDYNDDPHVDCFQTFNGGGDHVAGYDILFDGNSCRLLNDSGGSGTTKGFQVADGSHHLTIINNLVHAKLMAIFDSANAQTHDVNILNNTFAGYPADLTSWGIDIMSTNYLTIDLQIRNNIFAYQENGLGSIRVEDPASGPTVNAGNNCVYRATGSPWRLADPGDVWGVDPQFVDASSGDYHLQSTSPCIDEGVDFSAVVVDDHDGVPRPQGSAYDMGAFEYHVAADAGTNPGNDAEADGPALDGPGSPGGCGCGTAGSTPSSSAWSVLGLVGFGALRARFGTKPKRGAK